MTVSPPAALLKSGTEHGSEIDVVIESPTWVWFIEAKYHSDISIRTTMRSRRDQVLPNINVGSYYAGARPFFFSLLIESEAHESLLRFVRGLDHVVPERVPATREGWRYLARVLADLPYKAWIVALGEVGFDTLGANRTVPAGWRPWAQRLGLGRALSALEDFYDYARRYPEQALLPPDQATNLRAVNDACARWRGTVEPGVLAYYYDRALPGTCDNASRRRGRSRRSSMAPNRLQPSGRRLSPSQWKWPATGSRN